MSGCSSSAGLVDRRWNLVLPAPGAGALTLAWLIGFFALLIGATLIGRRHPDARHSSSRADIRTDVAGVEQIRSIVD